MSDGINNFGRFLHVLSTLRVESQKPLETPSPLKKGLLIKL